MAEGRITVQMLASELSKQSEAIQRQGDMLARQTSILESHTKIIGEHLKECAEDNKAAATALNSVKLSVDIVAGKVDNVKRIVDGYERGIKISLRSVIGLVGAMFIGMAGATGALIVNQNLNHKDTANKTISTAKLVQDRQDAINQGLLDNQGKIIDLIKRKGN